VPIGPRGTLDRVTSSSRPGRPLSAAVTARNGALRRLTALNRLAAAGAVALVLGFTALAAEATPAKHDASTAASTATVTHRHQRQHDDGASSAETATSSSSDSSSSDSSSSGAQSSAPAQTSQPPVVVSGGS
jgi:hypothetical protein